MLLLVIMHPKNLWGSDSSVLTSPITNFPNSRQSVIQSSRPLVDSEKEELERLRNELREALERGRIRDEREEVERI